jgi:eight-cysteine-cluster-containing protein
MQALKIMGLLLVAAILAVVALVLLKVTPRIGVMQPTPLIASFEECEAAGNPVMESYPRQCRTPDGRIFVEELPDVATSTPIMANGCAVAGCSGQLCVSAEEASTIVTTCEFRDEYACYAEASCEPQADGKCGWTQTAELTQCLANPQSMEAETQMELEVM